VVVPEGYGRRFREEPACIAFGSGRGCGGLAQLVEHLLCKQGVSGSNPLASIVKCGLQVGWSSRLPSHNFLPGLGPGAGMFFETVNRIWRMNYLPWRLGEILAVGWDGLSEMCVKLAKA
jgi:hypothetical protein